MAIWDGGTMPVYLLDDMEGSMIQWQGKSTSKGWFPSAIIFLRSVILLPVGTKHVLLKISCPHCTIVVLLVQYNLLATITMVAVSSKRL